MFSHSRQLNLEDGSLPSSMFVYEKRVPSIQKLVQQMEQQQMARSPALHEKRGINRPLSLQDFFRALWKLSYCYLQYEKK